MRVYILRTFFQDTKSSTAKHQKVLLEAFYGTSKTYKLDLFTKTVNGF